MPSSKTTTGISRSRFLIGSFISEHDLWNTCPSYLGQGYTIALYEKWYDYEADKRLSYTIKSVDCVAKTYTLVQYRMVKQVYDMVGWVDSLNRSRNRYRIIVKHDKEKILDVVFKSGDGIGRRWNYATQKFEPLKAVSTAEA